MQLANAIKKLGAFGKVETDGLGRYWAIRDGYSVEFLINGREGTITNERVRRVSDRDDSMTDYSAGTYTDSLAQAIRFARNWSASLS